jgi:hypothetical protein
VRALERDGAQAGATTATVTAVSADLRKRLAIIVRVVAFGPGHDMGRSQQGRGTAYRQRSRTTLCVPTCLVFVRSRHLSRQQASRAEFPVHKVVGLGGGLEIVRVIGVWAGSDGACVASPGSSGRRAVLSELVSEAKFPASWENTGNFAVFGRKWDHFDAGRSGIEQVAYGGFRRIE